VEPEPGVAQHDDDVVAVVFDASALPAASISSTVAGACGARSVLRNNATFSTAYGMP
jgi:hypothetical protein